MKALNIMNILFLSSVVVLLLIAGFVAEKLKVLFYKIKDFEVDYQPQNHIQTNFKTHSRLAF